MLCFYKSWFQGPAGLILAARVMSPIQIKPNLLKIRHEKLPIFVNFRFLEYSFPNKNRMSK
jgi:hypothetical protein